MDYLEKFMAVKALTSFTLAPRDRVLDFLKRLHKIQTFELIFLQFFSQKYLEIPKSVYNFAIRKKKTQISIRVFKTSRPHGLRSLPQPRFSLKAVTSSTVI